MSAAETTPLEVPAPASAVGPFTPASLHACLNTALSVATARMASAPFKENIEAVEKLLTLAAKFDEHVSALNELAASTGADVGESGMSDSTLATPEVVNRLRVLMGGLAAGGAGAAPVSADGAVPL